ncbi:MAG: glycerol-3-phosphate 1-O-acyltransferase PlsY [Proteobacteria bacterium]|nr:glycerol-3-phosphate 1-O-acyltransferase PlsY [Pseudomonadota bacterium]HQR04108.1 glycerol-3-phosphate 1-O-acyltransferase PlsY [Rhodocyclaceae bacterium]
MHLVPYALIGYLLGSIPFAVIVSRIFGLADPRTFGSGNPGATNVLRAGNRVAAALTLLGDTLKGWAAMEIARHLDAGSTAVAIAGISAFIGHLYPLFLRFRGGKGVATALGVLIGFDPLVAIACAALWLLMARLFRYSSLAAIAAAVVAPFVAESQQLPYDATSIITAMSLLLVWRHRENIRRLRTGTESRLGQKKSS